MIGFLLLGVAYTATAGQEERRRDERVQSIADNVQYMADRERKRRETRKFLAERGLQSDDAVLARMGL
jgi:hypothetical protein